MLVVFAGLIYAVAGLVGSLFAGSDKNVIAGQGGDGPTSPSGVAVDLSGGSSTTSRGEVAAEVAATATTGVTSTTIADAGRTPTPADPARIYIAGDSDAGAFAPYLQRLLKDTGVTKLTVDYKVSTGLARPDFFDWPARLSAQIPAVNPDIVIVTFGGNDGQPIHGLSAKVDTPEWRAEYAKRVGAAMDFLSADGRALIWVGIPNAGSPDFTGRLKIQNEVVVDQASKHPNVVFVDSWSRFSGIDGGYAEYVLDPRDGVSKPVRAKDGFHLNETGAKILALDIANAVNAELRNRGAAI